MARIKNWDADEIGAISGYLRSTTGAETLLKLRNNKGNRNTTIVDEIQIVIGKLTRSVRKAGDDQSLINQAYEGWIGENLVEGARAKLLHALRSRVDREVTAKKVERGEVDPIEVALGKLYKKFGWTRVDQVHNSLR